MGICNVNSRINLRNKLAVLNRNGNALTSSNDSLKFLMKFKPFIVSIPKQFLQLLFLLCLNLHKMNEGKLRIRKFCLSLD